MSRRASMVVVWFAGLALGGCRDGGEPARSPEETRVNRAHREVKTELGEAAGKTRKAVDKAQRSVQDLAGKGATELGIRRDGSQHPGQTSAPGRDGGS